MALFASQGFAVWHTVLSYRKSVQLMVLAVFDTAGVMMLCSKYCDKRSETSKQLPLTLIDCSPVSTVVLEKLAVQD
jgi:hypothetical protein